MLVWLSSAERDGDSVVEAAGTGHCQLAWATTWADTGADTAVRVRGDNSVHTHSPVQLGPQFSSHYK